LNPRRKPMNLYSVYKFSGSVANFRTGILVG
jgi:hypothetical protein